MLQISTNLTNQPVLSLRTGGQIATALDPVFNPNNLKIEGFYCQDSRDNRKLILLAQDIRDRIQHGFVVNDHEALVEPDDLVRLESVLKLKFELLGKPVVTVSKRRLGKVIDYAVDDQTLYVQKIYVSQSLIKSFNSGSLGVDRSQIVEITDRKIVIQEPLQGVKSGAPVPSASPVTS